MLFSQKYIYVVCTSIFCENSFLNSSARHCLIDDIFKVKLQNYLNNSVVLPVPSLFMEIQVNGRYT